MYEVENGMKVEEAIEQLQQDISYLREKIITEEQARELDYVEKTDFIYRARARHVFKLKLEANVLQLYVDMGVVSPTDTVGEFKEIFNPNDVAKDMKDFLKECEGIGGIEIIS